MMRRANLSSLIIAVLGLLVMCGSVIAFSGAGSGTESDPYVITTVEQLQEMNDDLGTCYALGNDIDASDTQTWNGGEGFVPVGAYTGDPDDAFTGDFDGRGHSINGLYINRISSSWQGLFGYVRNATVKDVLLTNAEVTADLKSGTLAGEGSTYSTITNCSAIGTLTLKAGTGDSKSGGLVGFVTTGTHVSECSSGVNVTAGDRKQVGGLIGVVEGRSYYTLLDNSYSTGTVTGGGSKQANLVGDADGSHIDRCYSCGYGKALIGFNWKNPVITNCYWDKDKGASSSPYGGTPKTTAQMMQQATFVNWDFVNIWGIVENETYPFLWAFEDRELTGLHILGPEEVAENFRATYKLIAHYDNNSTRDVTALAEWSVRPDTSFAEIEAGLLTTKEVGTGRERIAVAAQYSEGNITFVPMKPVTIFAVCPSGSALEFDGDYVETVILNLDNISTSAWIKVAGEGRGDIISNHENGGYGIFYTEEGNLRWSVHINGSYRGAFSNTSIQQNQWYHVAATYDGDNGYLYVDGVKQPDSFGDDGVITDTGVPLIIGGNPLTGGGIDNPFDGTIDEVVIYDRALTAEEIWANMHTRLSGDEPNLVGYWDFDEGEGQIAYDSSGNGNNGRLGSTPYADNSDPAWVESDAPVGICPEPVDVDIKPGSCPNPLNVASRGVVPAAILGSAEFDVSLLDAASIELVGVGATRSSLEDVARPVTDGNECECTTEGPDGYTDLTLKFNTGEVVEALGEVTDGDVLPVTLTGVLQDGTRIEGTDCVEVVGKFKPFNKGDINKDGVTNIVDFAMMAEDWLESTIVQD